jgi:tungstate transport system substrate-binding protein
VDAPNCINAEWCNNPGMPGTLVLLLVLLAALTGCGGDDDERAGGGTQLSTIVLATTTSTQDSGLLDELIPAFERDTGVQVKTVAVGSGAAIEMGRRGEADVVLAHSPAAERKLVQTGVTGERRPVMHNDFVIVGPPDDPAGVRGAAAPRALAQVARREATFVSRGDESGTHAKELALWEHARSEPAGDWYVESGQGMGETLRIASERGGYTVADRGTYLSQRGTLDLEVLVEGDDPLLNPYHVIPVTGRAGQRVNEAGGRSFARWVAAPEAQRMIAAFGRERFGQPLFTPDAVREAGQEAA